MNSPSLNNNEIVALWLLRLFTSGKTWRRLIHSSSFRDDDVACAIGLEDWTDADNFSPSIIRKEMIHRHRQLATRFIGGGYNHRVTKNFGLIQRLLQLNPCEREVLTLLSFMSNFDAIRDAWNILENRGDWSFEAFAAICLHLPRPQIKEALSSKSRLITSGLVIPKFYRGTRVPDLFSDSLPIALLESEVDEKGFYNEILRHADAPKLSFSDFSYLNPTLANLRTYLKAAMRHRQKGVNILLHGPPGTGKTQLSRMLARELRASAYEVRMENDEGQAMTPPMQFARLRLANRLLGGRSLVIVDEAEDLFSKDADRETAVAGHKGLLHQMLESNPFPIIWITNSLEGFSSANIRRFDSVMKVENPPPHQRARVLRRICGPRISRQFVDRLSHADDLSPAVVARANRFATVVASSSTGNETHESVMERQIQNTLEAQRYRLLPKPGARPANSAMPLPDLYDAALVNCSSDLAQLSSALVSRRKGRVCLYGPPGTGKTSFAHHVGSLLKSPVHVHRVSDLQSPYIGVCEENIARAFRRAEEEKALLVLDEVDSFLVDRSRAHRSWEISQVNEFLTQLEAYQGIFFATTNLIERLDPAAMRRFDIKLLFDYLLAPQAALLFKAHCRKLRIKPPTGAELDRLAQCPHLTPGDFANVAEQASLNPIRSAQAFLERLLHEVSLKPVHRTAHRTAGFHAA